MKKIIFLSSLFISTLTFAQKEGNLLTPKWKVGDSYEYTGSKSEISSNLKTGETTRNSIPFSTSFSIIENSETSILFKINTPNFEWFKIIEIVGKYNLRVVGDIKQIDLYCSYDKKTGLSKLLNQSDVLEIFEFLKSTYPKWVKNNRYAISDIKKEIDKIAPLYSSEEAIGETYKAQINWFISNFNKKQVLNQEIKESSILPLADFGDVTVKTTSKITEINKNETSFTQERKHLVDGEKVKAAYIVKIKEKDVLKSADMENLKEVKTHTFTADLSEKYIYNYKATVPILIEKTYEVLEKSKDIVIVERQSNFNLTLKK
ncbi:MAG: hypothetical protein ACPG6V_03360 [Flavobacteriales bacterium]